MTHFMTHNTVFRAAHGRGPIKYFLSGTGIFNLIYIFKVQILNRTRTENLQVLGSFETNTSVGALPPKKCAGIFEDSESRQQCGNLGTLVGRWSKMVV